VTLWRYQDASAVSGGFVGHERRVQVAHQRFGIVDVANEFGVAERVLGVVVFGAFDGGRAAMLLEDRFRAGMANNASPTWVSNPTR